MTCSGFYNRLGREVINPMLKALPDSYIQGFVADRCTTCDRVRLLPMPRCPHCGHSGYVPVAIDPSARLYSWTTTPHRFHAAWADVAPYTVLTVDNTQGIRLHVPLCLDGTTSALNDGDPMLLIREDVGAGLSLPVAHPSTAAP